MKLVRRAAAAVVVLSLALASAAHAQALKQLPANPLLVIKLNSPEAVSAKISKLAEKTGLLKFAPMLADPLTLIRDELKIKEGLDTKGEFVVGIYDSAKGEDDPRILALIPVTDYKAFLGNLANVKTDGAITTFNFPDEEDPVYAANWGGYAAISPWKEMLGTKPTGVEVVGAASKQMSEQDVVMFVNAPHISKQVLPMFQAERKNWVADLSGELKRNPGLDPKYHPAITAVVNQVLNTVEQTLIDGRAATIGVKVSDAGINGTVLAEFEQGSYIGKLVASTRNTDQDLAAGLPNRKFFVYGGMTMNPQSGSQLAQDWLGPISTELTKAGEEGKLLNNLIDAYKTLFAATEGATFAYVMPQGGAPGQQAAVQQVVVYRGDATKIQAGTRQAMSGMGQLMSMFMPMPGAAGGKPPMEFIVKENAKTVDGAQLDAVTVKMNLDENSPEAMQAKQMMQMFWGGTETTGYFGPIDAKNFGGMMGGDDALLKDLIAAVKKNDTAATSAAHVKAVSDQLPKQKAMVFYVAVDNIATAVLGYMQAFGMRIPIQVPADMPPLGISAAGEGSAIRIDLHINADLITKLVQAGEAAAKMFGGGPQRPPGRL